jgi:hypothetical protein
MAGANSNIQITDLDFNKIKTNLKTFLQSQDTLKDYNYEGSALSTLLDILAYNTQYNAYYLNMVANEMFLDSALLRSSVVSQAKLLNYTPKSSLAPYANINLNIYGVTDASVTLPKFTRFLSEAIDGVNYNFVTTDSYTVNTVSNTATFNNVTIKQGIPASLKFTVDAITNPTYTFEIPETNVDTTTITVTVQQSGSNTTFDTYTLASNYLSLNGDSPVYFLQESLTGTYQIYFGDGVLGKKLVDGNVVNFSYIVTDGTASYGANSFVLMDTVAGYSNNSVTPVTSTTQGSAKESISSIKFQAPKSYAAQGRAVSKNDYITLIKQNNYGIALDAVNVWGGEENTPPEYGKIFVSVKPTGGYTLTDNQKLVLVNDVIKPISVLTVVPEVISPDYVYLVFTSNALVDFKKTTLTSSQISDLITQGVKTFCNTNLNTFNSTFVIGDLITYIQGLNKAIVSVDFNLYLQKRLVPTFGSSQDYTIKFGNALRRSYGLEGVSITPSFSQYDSSGNFYSTVYLEESPDNTTNIDSIKLVSGGSGYTSPIITISGDGSGATATATVVNGIITGITVTSGGAGYTQAVVVISDSTGNGAAATAVLRGNYGSLRSYYFLNGVKNILAGATHTNNAGTIDYDNGIITLSNFAPTALNNNDGIMRFNAGASNRIVSSSYDKIITLDVNDPTAITVNVTAK